MTTQTQLVTGLAGAIGCSLRAAQNQLVFVEYGGKLSRLNLFAPAVVASQGSTVLKGTWTFDLDNGAQGGTGPGLDIWWEQQTALLRRMTPQGTAKILNLGVVDFNAITADGLQALPYGTTPIPGNNDATNKLVAGDCFAVRTNLGNFAKVKVTSYGYDLGIQWVTYHLNPAYAVLGTGYTNPEDVEVTADGLTAYVTERTGNLVRVTLANANRAAATVVTAGLTAPQQLFLDQAHNTAYVVEYAAPGRLWRINLSNGAKSALVSNLESAVGLVLSADLQYAYVSEQTAGADKGRVSRIQLSTGARTKLAVGLISPFFLAWADAAQTALLVAERDPANRITSLSPTGAGTTVVVAGVPARPSSVAVLAPGRMLVCSDQVIASVDYAAGSLLPTGPLLPAIGFIPFDKINQVSGLATTDPGAPYLVTNCPFGGRLPIMVNHQRAANAGGAYFRVKVDGVARQDPCSDYKWNGSASVLKSLGPVTVFGSTDYYPVHPVSEQFLWVNPGLGMLLNSTDLGHGLHSIVVELVNGAGALIEQSPPLKVMVNNQSCVAAIAPPTVGGVPADTLCGVLKFGGNTGATVTLGYTALHPANFATYSLSVIKGGGTVTTAGGPVFPAPAPLSYTVAQLLGTCPMAGLSEYLYVAATMTSGWGRQSQYDAAAAFAFALAP